MKKILLFFLVLSGLLLSSCAGGWNHSSPAQLPTPVASPPIEADTILSCLAEHQNISRKQFKAVYKTAAAQAASGTDAAFGRLICLSLHEYASYKQFKTGMATLTKYLRNHPDASAGLRGIQVLMQRIDKEMTVKWTRPLKSMDEVQGLEVEHKELLERNEALGKGAAEHREEIKELQKQIEQLQKQIEQLKDIENIIKNRER